MGNGPGHLSGLFLFDVKNKIISKLEILRQFGFYPSLKNVQEKLERESGGAHSPCIAAQAFEQSVNHR
jgi:hypothetical protein